MFYLVKLDTKKKIAFLCSAIFLLVISSVLASFLITLQYEAAERETKETTQSLKRSQEQTKSLVHTTYSLIEKIYHSAHALSDLSATHGHEIKNTVETVEAILQFYEQKVARNELSLVEAQKLASDQIQKLRYKNEDYFWIQDTNLSMVAHPFSTRENKPEWYQPNGLAKFKDINNFFLFVEAGKICQEKGSGFLDYYWPKPGNNTENVVHKLSYVKLFKPWNWIIGTGIYLDEIESNAKKEAINLVNALTFSADNYSMLCTKNYQMLASPAYPATKYPEWYKNSGLHSVQDSQGKFPFREIVQTAYEKKEGQTNSYTLTAKMEDGSFKSDVREAYVKYFQPWDWIIAGEMHLEEIESTKLEIQSDTQRTNSKLTVIGVSLSILGIAIAALSTSKIVSNNLASIELIKKALTRIEDQGELQTTIETKDEIAAIFNRFLTTFSNLIRQIKEENKDLNIYTEKLVVIAEQSDYTSKQQDTGIKEIVSTMEDADQMTKKVALKVQEVSKIAGETKKHAQVGYKKLNSTLEKMQNIKQSTEKSIQGIQDLGVLIGSIWDIVNIINTIADQTKIIAFNAELEASAAGEAGKNFQIVATEIRRLADNTVSSTREIKNKINEIQKSSDHLVEFTEKNSFQVKEGVEESQNLQQVFENILNSSEKSAVSTDEIVLSTNQQVIAFDHILVTLKSLSEGISKFVVSSNTTMHTAAELKQMAKVLNEIVAKYR